MCISDPNKLHSQIFKKLVILDMIKKKQKKKKNWALSESSLKE